MRRASGLPTDAEAVAAREVVLWRPLDPGDRRRVLDGADWLLRHKRWEAAHGFRLDDDVRVVVAVQAALLVLELGHDQYRQVGAVVVHPTTATVRGERVGPVPGTHTREALPVLGLAQDRRGPVLLAWDRVLADARGENPGQNVVLHEFTHKLDVLDGSFDGTPVLDRRQVPEWVRVCTEVYEDVAAGVGRPPLSPYGGVNPSEFFAVATEAFFCAPVELAASEPDLYRVLAAFYRQDPAARSR